MTTTTRTTRKAPWAVVMTVLLAVIALVFGVLTMAAPATAKDKPDKPDNPSSSAPGQVNPKPDNPGEGSGDDGLVGGNPDVVCAGYMYKADGLSGFSYTINAHAGFGVTEWCLKAGQGRTYGNGAFAPSVTVNAPDKYEISHVAWNEGTPPPTPGSLCQLSTMTVVGFPDIKATAYTDALANPDFTTDLARCTPVVPTPGSLCQLSTMTVVPFADITATAYTDALASADYTTDLARCTPTDVEETVAPVLPATVEEPETVAPVLPGTVTEEPETVAIPAPATVPPLPATIPAGGGSPEPTVPTSLLALLVLGATALAASTVRLVRTTR